MPCPDSLGLSFFRRRKGKERCPQHSSCARSTLSEGATFVKAFQRILCVKAILRSIWLGHGGTYKPVRAWRNEAMSVVIMRQESNQTPVNLKGRVILSLLKAAAVEVCFQRSIGSECRAQLGQRIPVERNSERTSSRTKQEQ